MATWCFSASMLPVRSDPITVPLYVHISTLSRVTVMFLTDGGLPVNRSMLVGGVSQLALRSWPLSASHSDCSFSVFQQAQKRHKCIFYLIRLTNMFFFWEDIECISFKSGLCPATHPPTVSVPLSSLFLIKP